MPLYKSRLIRRVPIFIAVIILIKLVYVLLSVDDSDADIQGHAFQAKSSRKIRKGLQINGSSFLLDGDHFVILGGSFHYFRTHPKQWRNRLEKLKAAGLNTVTTYIPWNLHEPRRGQFDFEGFWNLAAFIYQVEQAGLYLIVRPGPYISADWEYGGLPSWLLRDPKMIVRSKYEPFLTAVNAYFAKLLPILAKQTYEKGGPIIALQIENEFGSYGIEEEAYLMFLHGLINKHVVDVLLFTSDSPHAESLKRGSLPGVLSTINLGSDTQTGLESLKTFQHNKPLMITEFRTGWFDNSHKSHHTRQTSNILERMKVIIRDYKASLNLYIFIGGTNHHFYGGATNFSGKYEPQTTSYDYDAPISECGDITSIYQAVRRLLKDLYPDSDDQLLVPGDSTKAPYGKMTVAQYISFEDLITTSIRYYGEIRHQNPVAMEMIDINQANGQSYGWILYRAHFKKGQQLSLQGYFHDILRIFLNGRYLLTYESNVQFMNIQIPESAMFKNQTNTLDLLVENMGRVNFKGAKDESNLLNRQRKGYFGSVVIKDNSSEHIITDWLHVPLQFDIEFVNLLMANLTLWKDYEASKLLHNIPTLFQGTLLVKGPPADTFLRTPGWGKGITLINGINMGRYWSSGPQKTLYLPGPYLKQGPNSVILFELETHREYVSFVDKPSFV